MRGKNIICLPLVLFIFACTSNDSIENVLTDSQDFAHYSNRRSYAEAVEIARNSIKILQNETTATRGSQTIRSLNLKNGLKAICRPQTRSTENYSVMDTLLYVFNFEDEQGFAVVSAIRQTEGLIAVIERGSYDPAVLTGNPAFETFMNMAKAYVIRGDEEPSEIVNSVATRTDPLMCRPIYDTVVHIVVEPKVSVRWGQGGRMGQYCPNQIAGCSNTATAQIMSYYQYPATLSLSYPGREINSTVLNWASMCNHVYTYCSENRDEADSQIGHLARQLGHMSNSSYDDNATGTTVQRARSTLQSLGYSLGPVTDYTMTNSDGEVIAGFSMANGLWSNRLVYMSGSRITSKGKAVGHAWIVDGCYYNKTIYKLLATYDGETWSEFQELARYQTCHNHINWG